MTEGSFEGVEGVKIFTREWQPAGEPRGVVVISHGLNAHSGLYEWAAQQFTSNGLAVYALDHRGRGRSEGERFFVKNSRIGRRISRPSSTSSRRASRAYRCSCSVTAPAA